MPKKSEVSVPVPVPKKTLKSQPPPVQTRAPLDAGSSSKDPEPADMKEPKYHLAEMIAWRGYDMSIIDDDCFRSFVKSLNPKFEVPSREEIETEIDNIFSEAMEAPFLSTWMGEPKARRMSLAVGKAKVSESEVIYMAVQFIDSEWNLQQMIRDAAIDPVCSEETRADIGLSKIEEDYELAARTFTVAWGLTDDHSKLKDLILENHALKRKVVPFCTTFVDNIFHSVAGRLYQNIDAKFIGDISKSISFRKQKKHLLEEALSHVGLDLWAYKEAWYSWYCFLSIADKEFGATSVEFRKLLCRIFGELYRAVKKKF